MTYREMKDLWKEDKEIFNRTGSPFHLKRYKLLESAIADAKEYKHSDCDDL